MMAAAGRPTEGSAAARRHRRDPIASGGLPATTLARVFLRSFFLQAAWNPRGMQNLGFAHAMAPALAAIYPDPRARARATARHLEFFNCHPYLAAGILGAAVRLEEQVAHGEIAEERVSALKQVLAPPFAALGDGFFWLALRPAAALLAAATAPALGLWSLFVFLGIYNAVHLGARVWLFAEGYRRGEGIVEAVAHAHVPWATALLKLSGAALAGILAARSLLVALAPPQAGAPLRLGHAALVAATIVGMTAILPRLRFAAALYLSLALGLAIGSGFF
jgi:PTS system mannose-specific IID component